MSLIAHGPPDGHPDVVKTINVEQFVALRTALQQEKATLEARLAEITHALSVASVAAPVEAAAPGKRHFSAATKAKMAAAQKARWAKLKGAKATPATPTAAPTKVRRKYSAEAKARMAAGAKARWAKAKAGQPAKPTVPAKPKRKLSAAGRANIIAATKARWARVNAAKAKGK